MLRWDESVGWRWRGHAEETFSFVLLGAATPSAMGASMSPLPLALVPGRVCVGVSSCSAPKSFSSRP